MALKPNYGIDAPKVIRNLLASGAFLLVIALIIPRLTIANVEFLLFPGFLWPAGWLLLGGGLMLMYSLVGKFKHREHMLNKVKWTGGETVLDVGAGRGLMLIGAAKRLTRGHATGIDIWNAEDLSGNSQHGLLQNASLEGVSERITVLSEDAREMSFPGGAFDVVFSNLCLHNIYQQPGRARACQQIVRVLKPGGVAVISDYKHMKEYAAEFTGAGMKVEMCAPDWTGTFPPLRILVATKPR